MLDFYFDMGAFTLNPSAILRKSASHCGVTRKQTEEKQDYVFMIHEPQMWCDVMVNFFRYSSQMDEMEEEDVELLDDHNHNSRAVRSPAQVCVCSSLWMCVYLYMMCVCRLTGVCVRARRCVWTRTPAAVTLVNQTHCCSAQPPDSVSSAAVRHYGHVITQMIDRLLHVLQRILCCYCSTR